MKKYQRRAEEISRYSNLSTEQNNLCRALTRENQVCQGPGKGAGAGRKGQGAGSFHPPSGEAAASCRDGDFEHERGLSSGLLCLTNTCKALGWFSFSDNCKTNRTVEAPSAMWKLSTNRFSTRACTILWTSSVTLASCTSRKVPTASTSSSGRSWPFLSHAS